MTSLHHQQTVVVVIVVVVVVVVFKLFHLSVFISCVITICSVSLVVVLVLPAVVQQLQSSMTANRAAVPSIAAASSAAAVAPFSTGASPAPAPPRPTAAAVPPAATSDEVDEEKFQVLTLKCT